MKRTQAWFALIMVALAGSTSAQTVEQTVGRRYEIRPDQLPEPFATESASNAPRRVSRPQGAELRVPDGFAVTEFAEGLSNPRNLAVAPDGTVAVALQQAGEVVLLGDRDGDGRADQRYRLAAGFDEPFGLAFHGGFLYVADTAAVRRRPYQPGQTSPYPTTPDDWQPVTEPGALGPASGHSTRNLALAPDGRHFYVAIGSAGNVREEPVPRATIQEFAMIGPEGGRGQRTFAGGLRNPVGLAFRPGTDDLYAVVNERDGLGDGLVPDYFTRVVRDGFYGWPYAYIGNHPQPDYAARRPDLVRKSLVPDVLFEAHSAPIGLTFYTGTQFPAEYRSDAFVALRGSWNRSDPTGYKVVRVPFVQGRPRGDYLNFAVGFQIGGGSGRPARVWGRPAGLAVAADGSLLVADDTGGSVWRIAWRGP